MMMPSNVKFYTNNFMEGHDPSKTASAMGLGKSVQLMVWLFSHSIDSQDICFPSSVGGERGCFKINLL